MITKKSLKNVNFFILLLHFHMFNHSTLSYRTFFSPDMCVCVCSFLCSMLSFLSSSKQLDNHFTVRFFRKGFAIFLTFSLSICSQTCDLKVSIHCKGCLKKINRALHKIDGNKEIFYKCKFLHSLVIFPFV